jgi:signal transduction histidine kinase
MPPLDSFLTPGSCDAASLVVILVVAAVAALVPVRLPRGVVLTFLPAVLVPSWLACGTLATADVALVGTVVAGVIWTRRALPMALRGGAALAGVVAGALAGGGGPAVVGFLTQAPFESPGRSLQAALFVVGYWLGESGFIELCRRRGLRQAASVPRSNLVANLLLLFPGLVLADLLLTRGPLLFVPMLLLFLLFLGLIALYVGATTTREEIIQERARFVEAAVGRTFIPPDILEERAMELTHELRSPLTAILGYAGLLAREAGSHDREREESYVASISASSNYMLRLVNNILDLQRLESDTEPLQLRSIDLDLFLAEALASIQPRADEKRVKTSLAVEPNLSAVVAHELLLRRSVDNLLSNAVKYTRPGDEIRLTASHERSGIAISVADTGIGLTREERNRLFERFFRGRRSEARVERGTGLGLSIVREAMRRLDGEVRVESILGEGSTFTLWLPLRPTDGQGGLHPPLGTASDSPQGRSPLPEGEAGDAP